MPARTRITPAAAERRPNRTIALAAQAYDARGYPLELPVAAPLESEQPVRSTGAAAITPARHDADVSVRIGDALATTRVTVGSHDVALAVRASAHFVTLPHGGAGALTKNAGCGSCVRLALLVFQTASERPMRWPTSRFPTTRSACVFDLSRRRQRGTRARRHSQRNQRGRLAGRNAARARPAGAQVVVRFPPDAQATRLVAIYVLPSKGIELSDGSIVLRNVRAIVAGH